MSEEENKYVLSNLTILNPNKQPSDRILVSVIVLTFKLCNYFIKFCLFSYLKITFSTRRLMCLKI